MTTMSDPEGRRTVADVLRHGGVSAASCRSDGSITIRPACCSLTDDGDLAHVLTHPRFGVEKTYRATVRGRLMPDAVAALCAACGSTTAVRSPRNCASWRRAATVGDRPHDSRRPQPAGAAHVRRDRPSGDRLVRLRFGPIGLGALAPGAIRDATEREIVGLARDRARRRTARAEA